MSGLLFVTNHSLKEYQFLPILSCKNKKKILKMFSRIEKRNNKFMFTEFTLILILSNICVSKNFFDFKRTIEINSFLKQRDIIFSNIKKFIMVSYVIEILRLNLSNYSFSTVHIKKFSRSKFFFQYFISHLSLFEKSYTFRIINHLKKY
jgi:hypothetical protein